MAHKNLEREETYEGAATGPVPDLGGLPGVARVTAVPAEELDTVYYDTDGLALLASGCTLRRRSGGHDAGWRLTLPAGGGGPRQEVRRPAAAGGPDEVPPDIARHLAARARGREVVPVARLRTHRERRSLLDKRDRVLAEVARDDVSAQVLGTGRTAPPAGAGPSRTPRSGGRDAGTGTTLTAWSQVGIELKHGGGKLLTAAGHRLREAGLRPAVATGLGHALAAADLAPRAPAVPPSGTAGDAVLARLRSQTAELLAADAAVRGGEPDAVHRMRMTVRRLRSALKTYRRLFLPGSTRPLAGELGRLGRVLGEARDHEVLAERLAADAAALRDGDRIGPALAGPAGAVAAGEAAAYRQAWRRVCRELDGARYYALLDALDVFLAAPPLGPKADRDARRELRSAARKAQRAADRRSGRALATGPGPERDRALHSARKAAKRLRYAAETARPVVGGPARRLAKRAKAVQQALGEHQDAVVTARTLHALAERDHAAGRDTFVHGVLYARHRAAADRSEHDLPALRARAGRKGLTRFR
ncbi:CYTH and CHAD domain-containing protein [Streptomyces sp. SL13]|uniref:CYTH and CHAD domain-containing protein n=1 Tax=Streptantibioticus silvisoli TaxID=2705255 RepID=A0AA90K7L6_9ACTN|nr:CYTH and CHAD domain-containing protein [Streptantibioticus silvisoli]MDI5969028.1 CYTH and CHAD domain-containing protein [Streptantibioticus silvisoli]